MCSSNWICVCGYKNFGEDVWCIRCLTFCPEVLGEVISSLPSVGLVDGKAVEIEKGYFPALDTISINDFRVPTRETGEILKHFGVLPEGGE